MMSGNGPTSPPDGHIVDPSLVVRSSRTMPVEERLSLVRELEVESGTSHQSYSALVELARSDASAAVRAEAIDALARACDVGRGAVNVVLDALARDMSPVVRLAAAHAFEPHHVGRPGYHRVIPTLVRAVDEAQGDLRAELDARLVELTGRDAEQWMSGPRQAWVPRETPRSGSSARALLDRLLRAFRTLPRDR